MEDKSVDRTVELELRLRAIQVNSQDTCAFWKKRDENVDNICRCYSCAYYLPVITDESYGFCKFKQR